MEILDLYVVYDIPDDDEKKLDETKSQNEYAIEIGDRIAITAKHLHDRGKPPLTGSGVSGSKESSVNLLRLECGKFGRESEDKMAFKNFLQQFHNCINIAGQLSNSSKLIYLRSYLICF